MTFLLRLYPRHWRRRYEAEMRELLASEPRTLRLAVDLVAGAIDARVNPHWTPHRAAEPRLSEGATTMTRMFACQPSGISRADWNRSVAWMIGGSLTLVVISILLTLRFGRNSFSEALFNHAPGDEVTVTVYRNGQEQELQATLGERPRE